MRGIPGTIATREDLHNIAMDLPPADAKRFLHGLTLEDVRRVGMSQEEFYLLKSQVGYARWQEQARADKELDLHLAIENARIEVERARRQKQDALRRLRTASGALELAESEARRLAAALKQLQNAEV